MASKEETSGNAMSDSPSRPRLKPPSAALMFAEARSLVELEREPHAEPVADGRPARRRPPCARLARLSRDRHFHRAPAPLRRLSRLRAARLGSRPQFRRRLSHAPVAARPPGLHRRRGGTQGQPGRLEPRRRLRPRPRAFDARGGALGHHARQPVRQRHLRFQRAQALRDAVGRAHSRCEARRHPRARRRSRPARDGDLHQDRRRGALAHLPAERERSRGKHRDRARQPHRPRHQRRRACGRSPTGSPSRRGRSAPSTAWALSCSPTASRRAASPESATGSRERKSAAAPREDT